MGESAICDRVINRVICSSVDRLAGIAADLIYVYVPDPTRAFGLSVRLGPADAAVLGEEFGPEFSASDLLGLPNYRIYHRPMIGWCRPKAGMRWYRRRHTAVPNFRRRLKTS